MGTHGTIADAGGSRQYHGMVVASESARHAPLLRIALLLTALGSCTSATEPALPRNSIVATIDGVPMSTITKLVTSEGAGILAIGAIDDIGQTIHLTVERPTRTGPIQVGDGEPSSAATGYLRQSWRSNLKGGSGVVQVDALGFDHAAGSFSFTAVALPGTPAQGLRKVAGRFHVTFNTVK